MCAARCSCGVGRGRAVALEQGLVERQDPSRVDPLLQLVLDVAEGPGWVVDRPPAQGLLEKAQLASYVGEEVLVETELTEMSNMPAGNIKNVQLRLFALILTTAKLRNSTTMVVSTLYHRRDFNSKIESI